MNDDTPINIADPQFTHGEAVKISGISSKTLNNWTQRDLLKVGIMHRSGRRMYSITDLILLRVLHELTSLVGMSPSNAIPLAEIAAKRAVEMSERDSDGKLKYKRDEDCIYVIARYSDGSYPVNFVKRSDIFLYSLPHCCVLIPLDDIAFEVTADAIDLLQSVGG